MRKQLYIIAMVLLPLLAIGQVKKEVETQLINVSFDKTKHIVFPAHVSDIDYGREDFIYVERVENAPHIVRIQVQEEGFNTKTNLTIVLTNGDVYSYRIIYSENSIDDNIVFAGNPPHKKNYYSVVVNNNNATDMFFPADILYCWQGNEEAIQVEYYNNIIKIGTTFDKFEQTNLFVVDTDLNTYEVTINSGTSESYSYNFDDGREYIAHIDVNDVDMKNFISMLKTKKRNIYSVGVIKNKFEMSLANLYVYEQYMFFVFDMKNSSNINYDIDFVKCFQRDIKKMKNAIQQELQVEPVYQKDFYNSVSGKSESRFILAFNKFTIPDDKIFEIEMFEKGGGRHMKLTVLNEYILGAQLLK